MTEKYEITCPYCNEAYGIPYSPERREGATMDCAECDSLIVFWEGKTRKFHETLHELNDGEWPEDGDGTGYVEV